MCLFSHAGRHCSNYMIHLDRCCVDEKTQINTSHSTSTVATPGPPKVNVDEQQDDIKELKEQFNKDHKDDKDNVQEIPGAGTPLKKKTFVCVICNKICRKKMVEKSYNERAHNLVKASVSLVSILVDQ